MAGTVISSVSKSIYEITLDVVFSGAMLNNGELDSAANYVFTNGMYARTARIIAADRVRLWVELYGLNTSFDLTISNNVVDAAGDPLAVNTYTFTSAVSDATMSNYNTRIRTGRDIEVVVEDSQRYYLAGTRGIDVFNKGSATLPSRWAQVFDAYGINSMFVANFPGDLVITDARRPVLQNRNPAPGASVLANTNIYFEVYDADTSIDVTSLIVYVNGSLIYSGGYDGWRRSYSGSVIITHKRLNVTLDPPTNFTSGSTVSVRVVAQDLLSNVLDRTYSFNIL